MVAGIVGGAVASAVGKAIAQAAAEVIGQALRPQPVPDPHGAGGLYVPGEAPRVTAAERNELAQEIAQKALTKPEIKHIASSESPWKSRANWSAMISVAAPIVAAFGYAVAPEYQEAIAGSLWLIGSLISAYLARRARTATKPLGE